MFNQEQTRGESSLGAGQIALPADAQASSKSSPYYGCDSTACMGVSTLSVGRVHAPTWWTLASAPALDTRGNRLRLAYRPLNLKDGRLQPLPLGDIVHPCIEAS